MPSSVQLRDDYDVAGLRDLAKRCRDPRQIRDLQRARHLRPAPGAFVLLHQRPPAAPETGSARARGVQKNFPRTLAAHIGHLPKDRRIEIWFQDEARLGQKNGRTRLWAKTGTRPRLPADQRYDNAYLFGAICPRRGKGAALMLPKANTNAMQMHLNEISRNVAARAHAVVLMDRAGWHKTERLKVPKNLTIILLPSRSPEPNPVENIWQYLRQNWLSNRVFEDYDAILDAGCDAWNRLIAQPETIMSIGIRDWAHAGQ